MGAQTFHNSDVITTFLL